MICENLKLRYLEIGENKLKYQFVFSKILLVLVFLALMYTACLLIFFYLKDLHNLSEQSIAQYCWIFSGVCGIATLLLLIIAVRHFVLCKRNKLCSIISNKNILVKRSLFKDIEIDKKSIVAIAVKKNFVFALNNKNFSYSIYVRYNKNQRKLDDIFLLSNCDETYKDKILNHFGECKILHY